MTKGQEIDYQLLIKKFVSDPKNTNALVDITQKSTNYMAVCALFKQRSYEAKLKLEEALSNVEELKSIDAEKFAENLTSYLFENRKR